MIGKIVSITDEFIQNIKFIHLSVTKSGNLKAAVIDNDSIEWKVETLEELNIILDRYTKLSSKKIAELIKDHSIIKNDAVDNYYVIGSNKISKIEYVNVKNASSIDVDKINKIVLQLDSTKSLVGNIIFTDKTTKKITDLDALNAILDLFYAKGVSDINGLIYFKKIELKSKTDNFDDYYDYLDRKHFSRKSVTKSATTSSTISKMEFYLKDGKLACNVLYNDGRSSVLSDLTTINGIMNSFYLQEGKAISELITSGKIIVSDEVKAKYNIKDGKLSEITAPVTIANVNLDLSKDGKLDGTVTYTDGVVVVLTDVEAVNNILDQLKVQEGKTIPELIAVGQIVVSDEVKAKYNIKDGKLSEITAPVTIANVNLDLSKDGKLDGTVTYTDGVVVVLTDVEAVNNILDQLKVQEGKTYSELEADGKIVVSDEVKTKYNITDGKLYEINAHITISNVNLDLSEDGKLVGRVTYSDGYVEELNNDNEVNEILSQLISEEGKTIPELITAGKIVVSDALKDKYDINDKDLSEVKSKKRIKLRTIGKVTLIGLSALVLLHFGISAVARLLKNKKDENGKSSNDKKLGIDINEDGQELHTTYQMSDEEVIQSLAALPPVEEVVNVSNNDVYTANFNGVYDGQVTEVAYEPPVLVAHNYESLGSTVAYDTMEEQLDSISSAAVTREPFGFENIVVADDYDAIYALNSVRNKALRHEITDSQYMEILDNYVFNGANYINGTFVEGYNSLHPYAQFIVMRMAQGQSLKTFSPWTNEYNSYSSDLYSILTGKGNIK